jgi:hypothetical protein
MGFGIRIGMMVVAVALAGAAFAMVTPSAQSRPDNAWCVAAAGFPSVSYPYGHAIGGANQCPSSTEYWFGDLWLKNRAGNNLDHIYIGAEGNYIFNGNDVVCAGAYVHTHVYANDNGHGTSDTSGEVSSCV